MERVYRNGLDIDVALTAAARRLLVPATDGVPANAGHVAEPTALHEAPPAHPVAGESLRARIKRWLRRPVAITFRLAKPFLRPVAFRTRRYLTEGLHQDTLRTLSETQREIQRASAEVLREIQAAREILRHEVLAVQAQSTQEQRRMLTSLLQEQQTTRDLVRRLFTEGRHGMAQTNDAAIARLLEEQAKTRDAVSQLLAEGQQTLAQACGDAAALQLAPRLDRLAPQLDRLEQYGYASARRALMHCAADEVMVKTEVGYVMCSDGDLALLASLIDTGDLERGTRLLIQRLVQPGDTFVDVGANVGLHTLAAGRAMQGRGRIVAFEPFDGTRRLLEKTLWINGMSALAEVHGSAVWDREGVKTLFLGATSGHHSLFELGSDTSTATSVDVATVTLEGVLGPACPVDLIKIDAEGAELEVLRGALPIVHANPDVALIVEFGPSHLRRNAHGSAEWLAAFTDLGLEYRAIDANTGVLYEVSVAELEAAESTNLFFARPGTRFWSGIGTTA
jgi:FkbM family methyltransferase